MLTADNDGLRFENKNMNNDNKTLIREKVKDQEVFGMSLDSDNCQEVMQTENMNKEELMSKMNRMKEIWIAQGWQRLEKLTK